MRLGGFVLGYLRFPFFFLDREEEEVMTTRAGEGVFDEAIVCGLLRLSVATLDIDGGNGGFDRVVGMMNSFLEIRLKQHFRHALRVFRCCRAVL